MHDRKRHLPHLSELGNVVLGAQVERVEAKVSWDVIILLVVEAATIKVVA
jgi:hypothetical protein